MNSDKKLMLIEDDEIFVFITLKIIKKADFDGELKVFGNGKDAIEYLESIVGNEELLPEIIFLDLSMPILDGWGFLDEFLILKPKLKKKITIYIVTSSVSPHDVQRAKNISIVSDFIVKPISKERFIEIIKEL
jgi:CheY-like chemotaxis protein